MIGARARWFAIAGLFAALTGALWLWLGRETQAPSASPAPHAVARPSHQARGLASPANPSGQVDARAGSLEADADPQATLARLAALRSTYAARSTRKPAPDAELERVLVQHLGSRNDVIVQAALETARVSLLTEPPQKGVVSAVLGLTAKHQPASRRAAGLGALSFLRPDRRDDAVLSAFQSALDADEPELVSLALLALSQSGPSLESSAPATRTALGERVVALLSHGNPGVRGRALSVLAEVPTLAADAKRFEAGTHALLDRDPYVCAQAADLLARCRKPAAIHGLMDGVLDLRPARYELGGAAGVLVHELPGRRSVAEAMLFAIQRLGEAQGLEPLVLTLRDRYSNDSLLVENARIARSWYERNRASIPLGP